MYLVSSGPGGSGGVLTARAEILSRSGSGCGFTGQSILDTCVSSTPLERLCLGRGSDALCDLVLGCVGIVSRGLVSGRSSIFEGDVNFSTYLLTLGRVLLHDGTRPGRMVRVVRQGLIQVGFSFLPDVPDAGIRNILGGAVVLLMGSRLGLSGGDVGVGVRSIGLCADVVNAGWVEIF